jgi:uncharacterized protein YqeY
MGLKKQIEGDIKNAMLSKNKNELIALRSIKSSILLAETEKGASGTLSKDVEIKILMKAAKQRKDSAEIYESQARSDLFEKELAELEVIERYLPEQMSEEELIGKLKEIIEKVGAAGPQDMGKVMGIASKELGGSADGKTISGHVRSLLN